MPSVVNVVIAGNLGRELDVGRVSADLDPSIVDKRNSTYSAPSMYLRAENGSPLVTIYESGSFHVAGAESVESAEAVVRWLIGLLEELGVEGLNVEHDVKNVVVVGDLGVELGLNELVVFLGLECVEYEPEQFPGLIYRPVDLDSVFLVFASGRVVIPGSNSSEEGEEAFEYLEEKLAALV